MRVLKNRKFLYFVFNELTQGASKRVHQINFQQKVTLKTPNTKLLIEDLKVFFFDQVRRLTQFKEASACFNKQLTQIWGASNPLDDFFADSIFYLEDDKNIVLETIKTLNKYQPKMAPLMLRRLLSNNTLAEVLQKRVGQLIDSTNPDTADPDLLCSLRHVISPPFQKDFGRFHKKCVLLQRFYNFEQFIQSIFLPSVSRVSLDTTTNQLKYMFKDLSEEMDQCSQFQFLFYKIFSAPLDQNKRILGHVLDFVCQFQLTGFDFLGSSVQAITSREQIFRKLRSSVSLNDLLVYFDICKENVDVVKNLDNLLINFSSREDYASEFNNACLRQNYLLLPFADKKMPTKSVCVTRIGTTGISTKHLFTKYFGSFEFYSGLGFMKVIHEKMVNLLGTGIVKKDINGNYHIPVDLIIVEKENFLNSKLTYFYKELKYIYEIHFRKNYCFYYQKSEFLKILFDSLLKLDLIRFNMDFRDTDFDIDLRRNYYIKTMDFQNEVKDTLFQVSKLQSIYSQYLVYNKKDALEIISKNMQVLYEKERDSRLKSHRQSQGDLCKLSLTMDTFTSILLNEVLMTLNSIDDLNLDKLRTVSFEEFYIEVCKNAPFKGFFIAQGTKDVSRLDQQVIGNSILTFSCKLKQFKKMQNNTIKSENLDRLFEDIFDPDFDLTLLDVGFENKKGRRLTKETDTKTRSQKIPVEVSTKTQTQTQQEIIQNIFIHNINMISMSMTIKEGVYNKFSDLYISINQIQKDKLKLASNLLMAQLSLRWLLDRDPEYPFVQTILERVDVFFDRMDLNQRMSAVDSVLQCLFYQETNSIGIYWCNPKAFSCETCSRSTSI